MPLANSRIVGQPEVIRFIRHATPWRRFFRCSLAASNFPIPLGLNLLLIPGGHVLRCDVPDGAVQTNVVVMLHVTLNQTPCIFQRQRRLLWVHAGDSGTGVPLVREVPSLFHRNEGLIASRIIDNHILTGKKFCQDSGACCRSINVLCSLNPVGIAVRLLSRNFKRCRQRGSPTAGLDEA